MTRISQLSFFYVLFLLVLLFLGSPTKSSTVNNFVFGSQRNLISTLDGISTSSSSSAVSFQEISALYDFYLSLQGDQWKWKPTEQFGKIWNFTNYPDINPCDDWQGIGCQNSSSVSFHGSNSTSKTIFSIVLVETNLNGTIPESIRNFTNLELLSLNDNEIHGSLPLGLCQLINITRIEFTLNSISGQLPSCLFTSLPELQILALMNNRLTGTLPNFTIPITTTTFKTSLQVILLMSNHLHGPLPLSLGYLTSLHILYLGYNLLTGTIPHVLFENITSLSRLALNSNKFIGRIPDSLGNEVHLKYLYLHDNFFTSSIPVTLGNLTNIVYFSISSNYFTSSLPESLAECNQMKTFIISDNCLTGTLPSYVTTEWDEAVELSIYSNFFTGSLPMNAFNQYGRNLTLLLMQENMFTSNLYRNQLNTLHLTSLSSIDLSNNRFTGNLPPGLFMNKEKPTIQFLTCFKQCFTDAISNDLCSLTSLRVLDLDGMTANCAIYIWSFLPDSPKYTNFISGGIPSCVWSSLKNLTTFRISGNGLVGTIPDLASYGNLTDVDLSFNSLTGTIPNSLQSWSRLTTFNVENNKLTGNINAMSSLHYELTKDDDSAASSSSSSSSSSNSGVSLTLTQNRLSGSIPSEIVSAYQINILNGNLFSCSSKHPTPHHDPNTNNYVCGSELLDYSLFLFAGEVLMITTVVIILLILLKALFSFSKQILRKHESYRRKTKPEELEDGETGKSKERKSAGIRFEEYGRKPILERLRNFYAFLQEINNHAEMKKIFYKYRELKLLQRRESGVTPVDGEEEEPKVGVKRFDTTSSLSSPTLSWSSSMSFSNAVIVVILKILLWRSKVASLIDEYDSNQNNTDNNNASTGAGQNNKNKEIRFLYQFLKSLRTLRRIQVVLMVLVVFVTSPGYYLLKQSNGTYTQQYRWLISGAFLSGPYPSIFILLVWAFSVVFALFFIARNIPKFDETSFMSTSSNDDEEGDEDEDSNSSHYEEDEENEEQRNSRRLKNYEEGKKNRDSSRSNESIPEEGQEGGIKPFSTFPASYAPSTSSRPTSTSSDRSGTNSSSARRKNSRTAQFLSTITKSDAAVEIGKTISSTVSFFQRFSLWISLVSLLFNAAVVIVMKSAFIYLLLSSNTTFTQKVFIELSLSTVDVIWGSIILPQIISNLPKLSSNTKMVLKTTMLYFNNIVVPIVIIMVEDQSCFNGLFVPSNTVSENYGFDSCLIYPIFSTAAASSKVNNTIVANTCFLSINYDSSLSYTPFFYYNYNCYSSVLTSYIPIYLISYLALTVLMPSVSMFILSRRSSWKIMKLFPRLFFIESDNERELRYQKLQQENNKRSTRLPQNALEYLNSMLLEENVAAATNNNTHNNTAQGNDDDATRRSSTASDASDLNGTSHQPFRSLGSFARQSQQPQHQRPSHQEQQLQDGRNISTAEEGRITRASVDSLLPDYGHQSIVIRSELYDEMIPNSFKFFKKTIFFPEFILASSMHHLLIMLTFGLMSPVLMIVVALLTTVTSLLWEVLIGRWLIRDENYLGDENDKKFSGPYTTKLDELCIHVCRSPRKCVFLLTFGTGVFYALIVLDIAGDKDGWYNSLWAPLSIMAVATILFTYFNYFYNVYATILPGTTTSRGSSGSKEGEDGDGHENDEGDGDEGREGGESITILNPIHKMMIMARLDEDHDDHGQDHNHNGDGGNSPKHKKRKTNSSKKMMMGRLEFRSQRLTLEQIRTYQKHQEQLRRIQERQNQQLLLQQQQQSPLTTLKKTLFPADREKSKDRDRDRERSKDSVNRGPARKKDSMIELSSIYPPKNEH